jgi:uncharacterized protein (DUF1501 family)
MRVSAGYAGMAVTPLMSSMLNLGMTGAATAALPVSGYKALVCIFLNGGADSYNLLVPTDEVAYTDYRTARGSLALAKESLLPIGDAADPTRSYGLHPGLSGVRDLYNDGNLAFVANAGALIEPLDISSYYGSGRRPLGLFSHNDQRRHWQSSRPQLRNGKSGWAGRMSELLNDPALPKTRLFSNIAVGSTTLLQTGTTISPYVVNDYGNELFNGYGFAGSGAGVDKAYTRATAQVLESDYTNVFRQTYADHTSDAIAAAFQYRSATELSRVNITTPFPGTSIGQALRQIAYAIAARMTLEQSRQIFFVNMNGWDHHDNLLSGMNNLVPQLSAAMQAFYAATQELGVAGDVTSFTVSDFGRTLSSNGDGSDHAWGGNVMVMGGAVNGGRIYGAYPESLVLGNDLDVGRGRMIPTTSIDEYHAELARWFGIGNDDNLELVLPNIRNFYPSDATAGPLGMFA